MKEIITEVKATITAIIKVEDDTDIPKMTNSLAAEWIKDTLGADNIQVSKVKQFIMEDVE